MAVKGKIQPNHIPQNSFKLVVAGLPDITFVMIGSIARELETSIMPDRTTVSGGNLKHVEFDAEFPAHHTLERKAFDAWLLESQLGAPTYKKTGILQMYRLSGGIGAAWTLTGLYVSKIDTTSLDAKNEGEQVNIKVSLKADAAVPIV